MRSPEKKSDPRMDVTSVLTDTVLPESEAAVVAAAATEVDVVVGVSTTGVDVVVGVSTGVVLVVVSGATYTSEVLLLVVGAGGATYVEEDVAAGGATYVEEELGVSTGAMTVELEELEALSRKSPGVGLVVTVASVVEGMLALWVG